MKIHRRFSWIAALVLTVGLVLGLSACDREGSLNEPSSVLPLPPIEEMCALHNEFLASTFHRLEEETGENSAKAAAPATEEQKLEAAFSILTFVRSGFRRAWMPALLMRRCALHWAFPPRARISRYSSMS